MSDFHVFDTYATASSGRILHFDVVLAEKNAEQALACAHDWLAVIGEPEATLRQQGCCFCHTATEAPDTVRTDIARHGYAIIRLEGCPK